MYALLPASRIRREQRWGENPSHVHERKMNKPIPNKVKRNASKGAVTVTLRKLHTGQLKISEHAARFRVVMCGRRFGKTALGVTEACKAAVAGHKVGWFSPSYKYATEVWDEINSRLSPITQRTNAQERRLELVSGGVIEVWTMDTPDPGRGRAYHLAVIDEAGLVKDLKAIWDQAIRPTLTDYVGRALVLGTPKGRRHGFVTLFNRGLREEEEEWQSFRAPTLDNPYIPAEEIEAARKELPPEAFAQEYEGIPLDDGVNPFGLEAIRGCIGDVGTAPVVVWGIDLARAQDFTVVVGLDAWRRVVKVDRWQAPWAQTKERVQEIVGDTPAVVDATGVGDAIVSDLQHQGCMVTGYVFTQPSKLRLMQRLITAFQSKELVLPEGHEGEWLVAELESFEFTYTNSGVRYEAPQGEHDDGVMALALALYGWDRVQGVPPEAMPVLTTRSDDPYVADGVGVPLSIAGDFSVQLPGGGW